MKLIKIFVSIHIVHTYSLYIIIIRRRKIKKKEMFTLYMDFLM